MTPAVSPSTGRVITPKRKRTKNDNLHSPAGSPYFIPGKDIGQVDSLSINLWPSGSDYSSERAFPNSLIQSGLHVAPDILERLGKLKPLLIQGMGTFSS